MRTLNNNFFFPIPCILLIYLSSSAYQRTTNSCTIVPLIPLPSYYPLTTALFSVASFYEPHPALITSNDMNICLTSSHRTTLTRNPAEQDWYHMGCQSGCLASRQKERYFISIYSNHPTRASLAVKYIRRSLIVPITTQLIISSIAGSTCTEGW
jgi:hypothetical protein